MRLDLVASKDKTKGVLCFVKITKRFCVATNRAILAAVPTSEIFNDSFIEQIPEEGFLLSPSAYKEAVSSIQIEMDANKNTLKCIKKNGDFSYQPVSKEEFEGIYPNWEFVIPSDGKTKQEHLSEFGISSKLLDRLSKGLGFDLLKIKTYGGFKPIYVSEAGLKPMSKAYGIIMPLHP